MVACVCTQGVASLALGYVLVGLSARVLQVEGTGYAGQA